MAQKNVYRTELTPVSFLERSAYVFPDKVAVVHGARRYTYRQFEERVNRLASALRGAGLAKHDRVAFLCPNIPAMLEAHFGVPAAGGILVAINTRLSSDEIGYILEPLGRALPLRRRRARASSIEAARPARRHASCASTTPARPAIPTRTSSPRGSPEPVASWLEDEEETISINYTSGTTGPPEGRDVHPPRRLPQRPRRGASRPA